MPSEFCRSSHSKVIHGSFIASLGGAGFQYQIYNNFLILGLRNGIHAITKAHFPIEVQRCTRSSSLFWSKSVQRFEADMAAVQKHPFLAILSSSMVITHHLAFEFQEWWCWEAQVATRMVLKPKKRTSVSTRHLGSYSHPHNELLRKKQHMSLLPIEGPICFKRLCGSNQGSKLVRHWNFTFTSF